MEHRKLILHFDVVSPFSYMACYVVGNSSIFKQVDVEYVPVLLGGIMKACSNTPPIRIKNKDKWINKDRLRWADLFNVPFAEEMPEGWPHLTLIPQRAMCAVKMIAPDQYVDALKAVNDAYWVHRKQVINSETMLEVLQEVLDNDTARKVMEKSQTEEVKAVLQENTQKAIEEGAFGLPWFAATNAAGEKEYFWGFDHLGQVIHHLGLDIPTSQGKLVKGWMAML